MTWLQKLLLSLYRFFFPPRRAKITLGKPYGDSMAKTLVKSGAPVTMTDLQKDGAVLTIYDGAGLAVPPSASWGVVWSSSNPAILTVTPDPTGLTATIATPTPAVAGTATVSAVVTPTPGGAALPAAVSPPITVTGSTPASADITLGQPQ